MSVKREFIDFVSNYISNINVILEIGSRDAIQSIQFSNLFPKAKIYAFECNPPNIKKCIENTKDYKNIEIIPKAVFNKTGKTVFYPVSRNIGAGSLFKIDKEYGFDCEFPQKEIVVDTVRISTWARSRGIKKIDLIWIDVQGAEYQVFRGMGKFLQNVQAIFTEVENKELYVGQKLMKDVSKLLNKKGFSLIKYFKISKHLWGNAIFLNKNAG